MNRRQVLVSGGGLALGTIAGCLGGEEYPTETFDGVEVPLAPLEDVYEWYEGDETHVVDTQPQSVYDDAHIAGAVRSPAPDGLEDDDPVEAWGADERIITYCVCPHTLAVQRGATLIDEGYEEVYALDEGFNAWREAGYPVDGNGTDDEQPAYEIVGESSPAHAEESVYVREFETGEYLEISPIEDDGSYELLVRGDLEAETVLEVETPDYTLEAPLSELTSGIVTGQ